MIDDTKSDKPLAFHLGCVEPHAAMLVKPADNQKLFKVMRVEDLLQSLSGGYLHFNRVDSYTDFDGADAKDGQQLPKDRPGNSAATFLKTPSFTAAAYYDQSRARTYACCFSTENSDYIWRSYGNGGDKGKVCLVFEFRKLRELLNTTLEASSSALEYNGLRCHQIFSINYGLVEYVDWETHQANAARLPNPIKYTYLKSKSQFSDEKEFRVSLSALGIGRFVLHDGSAIEFPEHLHCAFDFRAAMLSGTIQEILLAPDCDLALLHAELQLLGVELSQNLR